MLIRNVVAQIQIVLIILSQCIGYNLKLMIGCIFKAAGYLFCRNYTGYDT